MFRELLRREFAPYGRLSDDVLTAAEQHYDYLVRWNSRMNLTRIESLEDVVRLHYCESFFLAQWLPTGPLRVADVGSGPGFPGVPIALLRPNLEVTLIESNRRKAVFLRESTRGIPNLQILDCRAQDVPERFDWVVSRAVSIPEVVGLNLAPRKAILATGLDSPIGWEAIALPWGNHHVLSVSRETPL